MTTTDLIVRTAPTDAQPTLITRPLLLRLVSIAGSSISYYLPLSVVPLYAKASGSDSGAGLATGVLLVAAVVFELLTPRLMGRAGYRWSLAGGLLLMGLPALALMFTGSLPMIIAVSIVRGIGFAITVVAGGALTASLIPPQRRGEGVALVGTVSGACSLLALPGGVWCAARWGYQPVFLLTAVAAIVAIVAILGLHAHVAKTEAAHGVLAGLRDRDAVRPALIFSAGAFAAGIVITFIPLAISGSSAGLAAIALLVQSATATIARWIAGRLGDQHGHARLLVPCVIISAVGMATLSLTSVPTAVIAGAAFFGAGFGGLQNATLAIMYARSNPAGYSTVSAIWNAAYDAGMAVGAIGIGLLAARIGYPTAFLVSGLLMLPAVRLARRVRTA
jgi:MFS family permease